MNDFEKIEHAAEKKFAEKDKRKKPKMRVTGKSVFKLQELMSRPHDRIPKRKNPKKSR